MSQNAESTTPQSGAGADSLSQERTALGQAFSDSGAKNSFSAMPRAYGEAENETALLSGSRESDADGLPREEGALGLTPEAYDISLPEHLPASEVDGAMLERFKSFCASSGLSPQQAQQAVDFYMSEQANALNGITEQCEMVLRSHWKEQFNTRLSHAKQACVAFDRRMQGRLMPLINAGLGSNPVFGELMALVGEGLSEDSFGHSRRGPVHDEAMSTEEFLRTVVFKGK